MAFARGKSNEDDDDNRTNSQAVPPCRKTENLGKLGARLVGHRHRAVTSPPLPDHALTLALLGGQPRAEKIKLEKTGEAFLRRPLNWDQSSRFA